jgi:hypothetical protein
VARGSVDNTATASARANGSTVTDQDAATMPTPSLETPPAEESGGPFNWDWRYPAPTCDALTVTYPRDLPGDQANDINVRIQTDVGEVTLNFHNNEGFWSGTTSFPYLSHPRWPAGATTYTVVWTQVAGTNYHWQGAVRCRVAGGAGSPTPEDTRALTQVAGWRTGSTTLDVGQAPGSDAVEVTQLGFQSLELEQRTADGGWRWVKTVPVTDQGTASVVFPKITEKGVTAFRLRVDGSQDVTGATTAPYEVRAR